MFKKKTPAIKKVSLVEFVAPFRVEYQREASNERILVHLETRDVVGNVYYEHLNAYSPSCNNDNIATFQILKKCVFKLED